MAHANVRVAAAQTGDAAEKQLVQRKEVLTEEIVILGRKIEEAEGYLERISLAEAECVQVEEELATLRTQESELLKRIDTFTERAEEQRIKSDELDQVVQKLETKKQEIIDAGLVLSGVQEKIRLAENQLASTQQNAQKQTQEMNDFIASLQDEAVGLEAKLSTIRTSIEHTNAAFMARSGELQTLSKELSRVIFDRDTAQSDLTELENKIVTAKHTLGTIDLQIAEKENMHQVWLDGEHKKLDERENDLASREGALSDRASMLDVRAKKLREAKARLENHFGTRLSDLIIE